MVKAPAEDNLVLMRVLGMLDREACCLSRRMSLMGTLMESNPVYTLLVGAQVNNEIHISNKIITT